MVRQNSLRFSVSLTTDGLQQLNHLDMASDLSVRQPSAIEGTSAASISYGYPSSNFACVLEGFIKSVGIYVNPHSMSK